MKESGSGFSGRRMSCEAGYQQGCNYLSLLFIAAWALGINTCDFLCCLSFNAGNRCFLGSSCWFSNDRYRCWRSWLAYLHGVQVVVSSSLTTPTNSVDYQLVTKLKISIFNNFVRLRKKRGFNCPFFYAIFSFPLYGIDSKLAK